MKLKNCIKNPPQTTGRYNITIEGHFSLLPIFMDFDGKEWNWEQLLGLSYIDKKKVYYFS